MELTKEYFDSKIVGLATKTDLERLASKTDLADVKEHLTSRIDTAQEELALMTKRGFDEVYQHLDVRNDVYELKKEMQEVRQELHLA